MRRATQLLVSAGAVAALAAGLLAAGALGGSPTGGSPTDSATDAATSAPASGPSDPLARGIAEAQARLTEQPQDYRTWADLGLAYVQQAKITVDPSYYAKAVGAVDRSLMLDRRQNYSGWAAKAALQNALHDFTGARTAAMKGIAINGYNSTLYGALADAETQLGRYDEAAAAVDRMNQLLPGVPAFTRASYVLELRGDVKGARSALDRALQDSPNGSDVSFVQNYLGELAFNYGGDARAALGHFQAGLAASPKDFVLLAGKAKAEAALGQVEQALADYRTVVNAIPQPQYVLELGELEQQQKDPDATRQYALFHTEEQLFSAAGVALDTEPTLFEADHGDKAKALQYCASGWKIRPFLEMADACAWANYVNGRYAEALGWSRRALATNWPNALLLFHRGMIQQALGDKAAAKADLSKALATNPHFNVLQAPIATAALAALN